MNKVVIGVVSAVAGLLMIGGGVYTYKRHKKNSNSAQEETSEAPAAEAEQQ